MIRSQKIFTFLALLVFALISLFGVSAAMNHEEAGQMGDCPFMGEVATLCSMTAVEHLSAWTRSFLTIPAKSYTALLLGILFVYLALKNSSSIKEKALFFITNKIVLERQQYPQLFNHLRALFSKGILHSRVYA